MLKWRDKRKKVYSWLFIYHTFVRKWKNTHTLYMIEIYKCQINKFGEILFIPRAHEIYRFYRFMTRAFLRYPDCWKRSVVCCTLENLRLDGTNYVLIYQRSLKTVEGRRYTKYIIHGGPLTVHCIYGLRPYVYVSPFIVHLGYKGG